MYKRQAIDLLTNGDPVALHGYTSAQGDAALREKLASYVNEQHSTNLTADNFYVTVGAAASLTISLKALAEPDDEFITFAPFFPEYRVFVEMTGSKLVVVPSKMCIRDRYYGDYVEWIKTDNIVTGLINPTRAKECLSEKGMEVGRIVQKDSILMTCIAGSIASIGRVCITDRTCLLYTSPLVDSCKKISM